MKKLLILLVALGAVCAALGQDLAQIAKQQIIEKIKLPIVIGLLDPEMIQEYALDTISIQLTAKPNGKVKNAVILHPSQQAINDIFITATRKIKLPENDAIQTPLLVVGFKLNFTNTDQFAGNLPGKTYYSQKNYKINDMTSGIPRSNSGYQVNAAVPIVAQAPSRPKSERKDVSIETTRRLDDINRMMSNNVVGKISTDSNGMCLFLVEISNN